MPSTPAAESETASTFARKPARRTGIVIMVTAAMAAGLLAVAAFTSGSLSPPAMASGIVVTAVNSFSGESSASSGTTSWQWITGTATEVWPNNTARGIATGSVVLGSSDGLAVSGRLGVCYQTSSGGVITAQNWEIINFTAPAGQWVTQTVSGAIVLGTPATYLIGLCVYNTSANLTFSTASGSGSGTVMVAGQSGPSF